MSQAFANNAVTRLASGVSESDVTLAVADGSVFPALSGNDFFLATLTAKNPIGLEVVWEIVRVASVSGGALAVQRGQEGTVARAWPAGTPISLRLTAETARSALRIFPAIVGPGRVRAGLTAEYTISDYSSFFSYFATFGDIGGALTENTDERLLVPVPDGVPGPRALSVAVAEKGSQPDPEDWVRFPVEVFVPVVETPGITNIAQGETTNERDLAGTAFVCNDPAERLASVEVQLASNESFANIIFETTMPVSPDHAAEPPRVSMPDTVRRRSYTMYARLRYHSASGLVSAWSEVLKFINGSSFFGGTKVFQAAQENNVAGAMSPDGKTILIVSDINRKKNGANDWALNVGSFLRKTPAGWREIKENGSVVASSAVRKNGFLMSIAMTNEKVYLGSTQSRNTNYYSGYVNVLKMPDFDALGDATVVDMEFKYVLPNPPGYPVGWAEPWMRFGAALAARGDWLVVGAPGVDKAYLYHDDQYVATLEYPGMGWVVSPLVRLGSSVALSDNADVVVVGYGGRSSQSRRLAEIFVRAGAENSWTHAGTVEAPVGFDVPIAMPAGPEPEHFVPPKPTPLAVSADGNTIVAGMTVPDEGSPRMAAIFYYRPAGASTWSRGSTFWHGATSLREMEDGKSVCMSGDGLRTIAYSAQIKNTGDDFQTTAGDAWRVLLQSKGKVVQTQRHYLFGEMSAPRNEYPWCVISADGSVAAVAVRRGAIDQDKDDIVIHVLE